MTTPSPSWKPLLTGSLAARVSQTVEEIARALDDFPAEAPELRFPSLAGGAAGEALLHGYLFLHTRDEQRAERAAALLETAADALATMVMTPGLYSGFAGIAWAVEHLQSRLFATETGEADPEHEPDENDPDENDPGDDDANREIDEALLTFLGSPKGSGEEYDLISGFTGLGVYSRERLDRPSAAAVLERVIDRLAAQAETGPAGTTWFTDPERLPDWQREIHPAGLYNLGAAHGMPAVIALLAVACSAGVAAERARPLLDGAVRWLLSNRRPPGSGSCFSSFAGPDAPPSRLAWCYGDPGVAATLLVAARAVGEPAWEEEALDIARSTLVRHREDAGVRDAGICHGAAGLAHLFNRFWQASGEEAFAEAARFWIERTLELRAPGEGIAGFRAWHAQPSQPGVWLAEPGFLEGATGVGLVLLAAVSAVEPEWDRILLVS